MTKPGRRPANTTTEEKVVQVPIDAPEAPPVPDPQSLHLGLLGIALVNLFLLVFVLLSAFAPMVEGGIISPVMVPVGRIETMSQPDELKAPQRQQVERAENRERFLKNWKLHLVVALSSIPVAIGLLRCSYFAAQRDFALGELRLWLTSAAAILLANLLLGWGGRWTVFYLLIALGQLIVIHVPSVSLYLAEATPEQRALALGGDSDESQAE